MCMLAESRPLRPQIFFENPERLKETLGAVPVQREDVSERNILGEQRWRAARVTRPGLRRVSNYLEDRT